MYNEFFKNNKLDGAEKLSKTRRKNIKAAVFRRINESENETVRVRRLRLKPALAAAAAAVLAAAGVTAGALSSPPEVKMNGSDIVPYYNVYQDSDGAIVEILSVELPPEMLGEEEPGKTPEGELKLGRSEIGDISKNGYSGIWLIDENGNEYFSSVNNMYVNTKITYPDKSTHVSEFGISNYNTGGHYSYSYSCRGYEYLFLSQDTEVCGHNTESHFHAVYDYDIDTTVEFAAIKLPPEALSDPVPDCDFPGIYDIIVGAELIFFDENGNKITPVLTDSLHTQTFPDGVNDLLIDIKITYSDGSVEKMRLEPINKLEGFNYDEIEIKYSLIKYENMLCNDNFI